MSFGSNSALWLEESPPFGVAIAVLLELGSQQAHPLWRRLPRGARMETPRMITPRDLVELFYFHRGGGAPPEPPGSRLLFGVDGAVEPWAPF